MAWFIVGNRHDGTGRSGCGCRDADDRGDVMYCEKCDTRLAVCIYNDAELCEKCRQEVVEAEIDNAEYQMEDR